MDADLKERVDSDAELPRIADFRWSTDLVTWSEWVFLCRLDDDWSTEDIVAKIKNVAVPDTQAMQSRVRRDGRVEQLSPVWC